MLFHAIIEPDDSSGIHHRTSIEAASKEEASRLLEVQYGAGRVREVWQDYEESRRLSGW